MLLCEKYWLDRYDAYNDPTFYNISQTVMGGNNRAGWSEERHQQFRDRIKDIWNNRTAEERAIIQEKTASKVKEFMISEAGVILKQKTHERAIANVDRFIEMVKNRTHEERSISSKLARQKMGKERLCELAQQRADNISPETRANSRIKAKETLAKRTPEQIVESKIKRSLALKGKLSGSKNGRATSVVAAGIRYDTLKDAMKGTNISEGTLHKRIKSESYPDYYLVEKPAQTSGG